VNTKPKRPGERLFSRKRALVALALGMVVGLVVLVFCADPAWARAGGGGGYGGGKSGGGRSGGGDSGGAFLIYMLLQLVFHHPVIGIPVAIIIAVAFFYGGKTTRNVHVTRTIKKGHATQVVSQRSVQLTRLVSRDPSFDEAQFTQRASKGFLKLQEAWSKQDLSSVRSFISDGIHERFNMQIAMQKAENMRNRMENVLIESCQVAAIYSDEHFDTIHLEIKASASDYTVSLKNGRRVQGSRTPGSFIEYWSFNRKTGVQTSSKPGSMEGFCPNCGSPLEIVDVAKCPACASMVNSGSHDWVLSEITQEQEWRVPSADLRVHGLDEFKKQDPEFNAQHIEDRVSVMFWRRRASEFFWDLGYAVPMLSERFAEAEKTKFAQADKENHIFWKDAAVGKVEMLNMQAGGEGDMDRLRVVVRWSSEKHEGQPGKKTRLLRPKAIKTDVYVLIRQHGVKSIAEKAFSSSGCTQCGAPIATKTSACEYCGSSLTNGHYEWVLDAIEPYTPHVAYRPVNEQVLAHMEETPEIDVAMGVDAKVALAVVANVMHSDGHFDSKEQAALKRMAEKQNLTEEALAEIINTAQDPDFKLPIPEDRFQGRHLMTQMVQASLADGNISSDEQTMLMAFAKIIHMAPTDVRMIIAQERKKAYKKSKETLRLAKKRANAPRMDRSMPTMDQRQMKK